MLGCLVADGFWGCGGGILLLPRLEGGLAGYPYSWVWRMGSLCDGLGGVGWRDFVHKILVRVWAGGQAGGGWYI